TIGMSYNHVFTDAVSVNGTFTYGNTKIKADTIAHSQPNTQNTGTLSGSSTYLSYEVDLGYSFSRNIKFNLGYRVEQYDALFPKNVSGIQPNYVVTLALQKVQLSGLIAGFVFAY
ncbi:MAG: hypothetical protein OEV15_09515, partial [Gallionella sp.]|nr:hypothetical protein [Gallionella sp.]